jgi:hypothetical protein
VTAQVSDNGITVNRSGQTTANLEVLYAIKGYDSDDKPIAETLGKVTVSAGQASITINPESLAQPESNLIVKRDFTIIPDGNDYVTGEQRIVVLNN